MFVFGIEHAPEGGLTIAIRRFLEILVIIGLVALLSTPLSAQSHRRRAKKRSAPSDLHRHLADVRAKKNRVSAELKATKRKANAVVGDIHEVDARLGKIKSDLDQTTDDLEANKHEELSLKDSLAAAEKRRLAQREQIRRRLRSIYLQGQGTVLSVIVGSKSVGDLITRQGFLSSIAGKDRELFDSYTALQHDIDQKVKQQTAVVKRINRLVVNQQTQKANLEDTREEKGEILDSLRLKQSELKKMLAQFAADEAEVAAEIAAYRRRTEAAGASAQVPTYHGGFIRPVPGRITSGFGMRYHPVLHFTRMHTGIDFGSPYGTPIHAVANGRVVSAWYGGGYGNRIIIDHGGGIMTLYGHCSRLMVNDGQSIRQGQVIGAVGSSGLATGPHLHFEVWRNGARVNPIGYL